MLTSAQQKVKQELEELQANAIFHHEPETLPPTQKHPRKKWFYVTIGFFTFIIIISSIFMIKLLTHSHENTISYLAIEHKYYRQSEKLLNECVEDNTADIEKKNEDHAALLKKVNALETPSSLKGHRQDLLDVIEQRQDILIFLAAANNSNSLTLNKKLIELNIKQELAFDSLVKAFEREKIKYILNEDGTIQYRVNGNVYDY